MTNREMIASVREHLKLNSYDSLISNRAILAELKKTAFKFIRQLQNARKLIGDPSIYTSIPCLEMIEVPIAECCSFVSSCTVARSKYKIPPIAGNIYGLFIQGVWSIDRKTEFTFTTPSLYQSAKLLSPNKHYYWIFNDYLYISSPDIELISLSAFFEDEVPEYLLSCGNTDENDCPENPYDRDFKAPSHLLDDITKECMNKIISTYKRFLHDTGNLGMEESK